LHARRYGRSVRGQQDGHQLGAGDAVHGGVVHLGDECELAICEPIDQAQLPQGTAPIELSAEDVGHDLAQVRMPSGRRGHETTDVILNVEATVFDPDRVVQTERHLSEPSP
jgi:hypothetical protein